MFSRPLTGSRSRGAALPERHTDATSTTSAPFPNRRVQARVVSSASSRKQRPESRKQADETRPEKRHSAWQGFLRFVSPEYAGDFKDWFWMIVSTGVFMYIAALLFVMYDYWYSLSGLTPISSYFRR